MHDLGTLGGPDALAAYINERSQITGISFTSTVPNPVTGIPPLEPFLWENGEMVDLGSLGGADGQPTALNNRGHVIGVSSTVANPGACFTELDPDCHPFLWDEGHLIDLNTSAAGGNPLTADAINEAEEIVGVIIGRPPRDVAPKLPIVLSDATPVRRRSGSLTSMSARWVLPW